MLVIADASPINALIRISLIELLPSLYGQVIIPSEVASELSDPRAPSEIGLFIRASPAWLLIRAPQTLLAFAGLDAGESAANSLAQESHADLLLIDERRGRRVARQMHLQIVGTIGVLELASIRGLVDLREAMQRIRQIDFSVSDEIIDAAFKAGKDWPISDHRVYVSITTGKLSEQGIAIYYVDQFTGIMINA